MARDEAIAAMLPGLVQLEDDDLTFRWAGRLLDRIPADVLARLAIEHGGLVEPLFAGRVVDATATAKFTIQADSTRVTYPAPDARVVVYPAPTTNKGTPT